MILSQRILRRGLIGSSPGLKPSILRSVSFTGMRTLLGKFSPLLCALIATGAATQVSAPRAASHNHLKESKSSYLKRASQQPVDWYPWGNEAFRKAKGRVQFAVIDLDIKRTERQQDLVKPYYRGYIPHVTVLDASGKPVYNSSGEIEESAISSILDASLKETK